MSRDRYSWWLRRLALSYPAWYAFPSSPVQWRVSNQNFQTNEITDFSQLLAFALSRVFPDHRIRPHRLLVRLGECSVLLWYLLKYLCLSSLTLEGGRPRSSAMLSNTPALCFSFTIFFFVPIDTSKTFWKKKLMKSYQKKGNELSCAPWTEGWR